MCIWGTKKVKKTRGYNTHLFHPIPVGGHRILHVGLDDGRSQTCQISAESVEGLQSPRELKMTLLIWRIALTTMYALTCDTVINKGAASGYDAELQPNEPGFVVAGSHTNNWWHQEGHPSKVAPFNLENSTLLVGSTSLCNEEAHDVKGPHSVNEKNSWATACDVLWRWVLAWCINKDGW